MDGYTQLCSICNRGIDLYVLDQHEIHVSTTSGPCSIAEIDKQVSATHQFHFALACVVNLAQIGRLPGEHLDDACTA